ncbi:hypothetical protein KFL_005030020 [Klebsormidium nitens]|uniref:UBA domain-containing protein n=1 Tax=Klebsormidium nitens TaxID=105231 RepID=A0A1Y1IE89_KLENI|nr:hypothetical protein KFL_005030020 [Klebsormidium nitens]|eukprot:GAQ89250.1 hypothetical protein KFL_005030020 [Klebsormidium nitens]
MASAALSLVCNQCGSQLKNMKEAQSHADATGHSDFAESTEAVLQLVCSDCGKPCRSKTEQDLHTQRTGHSQFHDKTAEAAKPMDTEKQMQQIREEEKAAEMPSTSMEIDGAAAEEMVVPQVDAAALQELQDMGFGIERATRALHFSGGSVESAINWVVEHENDANIDEMPKIPKSQDKKPLSKEEAKRKAAELAEKAKRKREEEERAREREREKERVRAGKELLEAKRIEEAQERKRIIELKRQEKLEEQRAREKIKARLEEDKAERRRKMGLPPKDPEEEKKKEEEKKEEVKKPFVPMRPASKAEQMRNVLRTMKQQHKDQDERVKKAFQTLLTYIGNVARAPDEEKYRTIRLTNAAFQDRVGSLGGVPFLELLGFEKDAAGETIKLDRSKVDQTLLNAAGSELNTAITNPFFGVL